ncbi:hypothetical protein PGTUg99_017384 [Puccinia graminis f. sp. tritici]|uniref:Uncharacterized protein n=1 Tax=Puccinia graminis f. sp. tritici TaxID=56615 RepID=A0A5B0R3V2_PUCGR|nr:hypothetical protein PGTUg99_017384 [Puccinia graminis f. sp. tritici]
MDMIIITPELLIKTFNGNELGYQRAHISDYKRYRTLGTCSEIGGPGRKVKELECSKTFLRQLYNKFQKFLLNSTISLQEDLKLRILCKFKRGSAVVGQRSRPRFFSLRWFTCSIPYSCTRGHAPALRN